MRIGIYDPYLDDLGGGEKYMLSIAECLSRDNEVTLFWNNKNDLDTVLSRFSLDLSRITISPNIFSSKVSLAKRLLESRKYDALIVLSDGSIPLVLSKKLFIHIQQPLPKVSLNIKTKLKLARASKIFCNSYFTKSFVDSELGVTSVVIYPPVSLHPKKVKKENIILHVGRFRVINAGVPNYKKQDVMVDVFKKMVDQGLKNWKFAIAAGVKAEDAPEFDALKKEAEGYPIEFLVNRSNSDLWDIYSKAKIYWHASGYGENLETHPEFAEHFGISTVEAMGSSAVPIVINAGGQKEIIEDGMSGFLWDNLEELAEKTLMLTSDSDILAKMSKEAKKRAQDFAGDRFCEEITKLIND